MGIRRAGPHTRRRCGRGEQKSAHPGLYEPGEPGDIHARGPDLLLEPEPSGALAQGRDERQRAAHRLHNGGLRPGRPGREGRKGRSRLPHGRGQLLL